MKTKKIYVFTAAILLSLSMYAQKEMPAGVTADWQQQSIASIQDMEYTFHSTHANTYVTKNPANRLGFTIDEKGYTVNSLQVNEEWKASFLVEKIGGRSPISTNPNEFVIVKKKRELTYQSNKYDIQYLNDGNGLRQNFIVREKPEGQGHLLTDIKINTSLQVAVKGQNSLQLHTAGKPADIKLIYDQLKVWDANHQPLTATMEYNEPTNLLTIIVNDENAAYPITIDPLNRVPEWTSSADGILPGLLTNLQLQVQTLYGYTVAGLGDINGDGYDDVAISAPTMADVITGTGSLTGVGAVFIYLGSPLGLSTTPSKILQPSTAVSGALFGFSVDAGDVTGDGKNDIVIGAPMDRYQTSASSLLGPVNVQVTAGKVYVYRSEDLFSSPNPTPFLQLRLQGTDFFSTGILGVLQSNVTVNPLFGFAVAVTRDLNNDNKADILIGSPAYLGAELLAAQSGAAFVYYSDNLNTTTPAKLNTPTPSLLGLVSLPIANTSGLLFGFSIDGAGDFNNDGRPDVVVGAPAGADLSSLGGIFTGQFLGGSAYVFFGNATSVNTTSTVKLQANPTGLLSNAANLFGYKVKGAMNAQGLKTGNILVGAPSGAVLSNVLNGLKVKAGQLHVFQKKNISANGTYSSNQIISSPRSSSILSILTGQTINVSLLYASSLDNMLDVNCDNIGDIIVGEPLSTAVPLIGADVVGGAAYIYLGNADGTYNPTPIWDLYSQVSPLLGVNTTALTGYSVAGARYIKGRSQGVRSLIGGPSNSLDFGVGLLNLGNTLGTTFDFAFDNNGLGKSYSFPYSSCNTVLPATLVEFKGTPVNKTVVLNWVSVTEDKLNHYELQRSIDATNFETIAISFAKGNQYNQYEYSDKTPFSGINYYRLKMNDNDGKSNYSAIVAVRFDQKVDGSIVVAPNPVQNDIQIRLTGIEKGIYRMQLQNAAGQTLLTRAITVSQFTQTEIIPRSPILSTGIYWLTIYDNTYKKISSIRVVLGH
jgi:FG-GAP repeat